MITRLVDSGLDRAVVPGYTKIGYWIRQHWWNENDPRPGALVGRTALVTGANSGLGQETALGLARLGACVVLVVRNEERGRRAVAEIRRELPGADVRLEVCDMSDLAVVRAFAADLLTRLDRLDVIVHNAGALPAERTETEDGHELTVALHVLGPVLLTDLLRPALAGHDARVVLVSSGGMYTQRLQVEDPDYRRGTYRGAVAYARSKRMQVALAPLMGRRWAPDGVSVHVMHPGWADTRGFADSLPAFRNLTRPLLRDATLGADTAVWLASTEPAPVGGRFWQDRAPRAEHYRRGTQETDQERLRLWTWVLEGVGLSPTDRA